MSGGSLLGLSQRLPPANLPAEQALLGALMANNRAYDSVSAFLREMHFTDPIHGRIYAAIGARIEAGRPADTVSLRGDFENSGVLDAMGGAAYLVKLLASMVGIINAADYGRAIHEAWWRRQLIDIGETLVNGAFGTADGATAREVHEAAEEALFRLADAGETEEASSQAADAMAAAIDSAVKSSNRPGGLMGITSGLAEIDDMTGGFRRGRYYLLAARPSMGKTTLALSIAAGAVDAGARVLFVSREMPREAIGAQLAAGLAQVPRDAAERGRIRGRDALGRFTWQPIDQELIDKMTAVQRAMRRNDFVIDECRSGTMAAVRSAARRMKRRGGLDLVVIDYLLKLRVPELARSDNRVLEVTRLSQQTSDLARDLDVPVLMLTQLNRENEKRDNKRPILPDLRDSGALEQDADVVFFLHRDHYYLSKDILVRGANETEEGFAMRTARHDTALQAAFGLGEVIFAKQRQGPTGTRRIGFDHESTWFHDLRSAEP